MSARRLIVNADDFGLSPGVNAGVIRGAEEGIVTSASLMVRQPAARAAAAYARRHPRLGLGLHVDLGEWALDGSQWRPVYEVVALEWADGVAREVDAQLEAFRELTGRNPTHVDSHQHVHRREPVRGILTALAVTLGVPLRHFSAVRYCGEFYGQDADGVPHLEWLTPARLIELVTSVSPGATELCCHPATTADVATMYRMERPVEIDALCDPAVRAALVASGVTLCSFEELQPGSDERV